MTRAVNEVSIESLRGLPEYLRLPLHRTLEGLARALNTVASTVEEETSGGAAGIPRLTPSAGEFAATVADPRQLTFAESGSLCDDVAQTAITKYLLPDSGDFEGDIQTDCPHFYFSRTSGFALRVTAGASDTIQVDQTDASAAGGTVDLTGNNSTVHLALVDDRWRAVGATGTWQMDV